MGFDTTARSKRLTFHPTAFNGGDRRKTTGVDVLVPLRPSSPSPWDLSIQILATALCSGGCHPVHLFLGFKEPCLSSAQRLLWFVEKWTRSLCFVEAFFMPRFSAGVTRRFRNLAETVWIGLTPLAARNKEERCLSYLRVHCSQMFERNILLSGDSEISSVW